MVAVVLVLLGTGEFLDFWRGETLHWVSWGLSVVAMLLLVARALWLYVPVWIARRRAMSSLARYILTGEGILIEGVGGQSKMVPWRQFRGFYTSTRLIVCFPSGAGDPVLIPAQDLSDSRRRDVESLVRSKLPEFLTRVECTRLD